LRETLDRAAGSLENMRNIVEKLPRLPHEGFFRFAPLSVIGNCPNTNTNPLATIAWL